MEHGCRPRGRFRFQAACTGRAEKRRQADTHAGTSGVHRTARDRLLLPRLSGKMAWHPAGRAAFSGAAGLYRWNADELDEERNGKLRIRVRVKRDLRFTALHRIKKRRSCVSSAILAYSCG